MNQKSATTIEVKMLLLLDWEIPKRTGWLGFLLWGNQNHKNRDPQSYARPAGKVLNRLRARELVDWVSRKNSQFGWVITAKGTKLLEEKP